MRNADFERCADFLIRMIEKYGSKLDLPKADSTSIAGEEAEVIRLIFDKYVHTTMGVGAVADWLNNQGYEKRSGRTTPWTFLEILL